MAQSFQQRLAKNRGSLGKRTSGTSKSSEDKMQSQINNYKTRLQNVGSDYDAKDDRNFLEKALNLEKDQNFLFDIFEILDRPRNALFTAINNVGNKDSSFGEGLLEGITGETKTSGKDILVDQFNMEDEEGKLDLSDVLGFGLDVVGDPTNWALPGHKSISDLAMTGAKKALKGTAKVADKGITAGLKALDKAEINKVAKLASRAGFETSDDFLKSIGRVASDVGQRSAAYQGLKEGFKDAFNQGATTLGVLKGSKRAAQGRNQLLDETLRSYLDPLKDTSYNYILRTSDDLGEYADDIAKATKYASKKGNSIAKWIQENPNNALSKVLKERQDTVASDILNMIQSGKNTSIKGRNALNDLINNGEFVGSEESVNALLDVLNKEAGRSGLQLGDVNFDLASQRNADEISRLQSIADTSTNSAERRAAQDQIDALLRQNSTLSIGDTNTLRQFRDNPNFRNTLDALDSSENPLRYNLEYNADEWNRLQELRNNPDFMDLVSQNENAYKEVADRMKNATGMDYSDIVNREGYVRKAQGTAADIEDRIGDIDELLGNADLTDDQKQLLQNTRDALQEQYLTSGTGSTSNRFTTQKYKQPAVVANRQYQEELARQSENISKQIDNLKNNFSREQTESLVNKLAGVESNSTKIEKLNTRLAKQNTSLEKINNRISESTTRLGNITKRIDDNFINKAMKVQDQSVTNNLAKELTSVNNLTDEYKKISKQLLDDTLTDEATEKALSRLKSINDDIEKRSANLNKITDIIDGRVDDTIMKGLDKNAREIQQYADTALKRDALKAAREEATFKIDQTQQAVNSLKNNLDKTIKNINYSLENINPANDANISKQIQALSRTKSILDSEAGETLFNLNFYAGIDDFISNAKYTNETAQVFKDALTMGVLNDESFLKPAAKATEADTKNLIKVSGTNLSNRLNAVQNIISDSNPSDELKAVMSSLKGNTYYMDPRAASLFGIATGNKQNTNALLNLVDKFNTTFKKFSTLTPGFQVRNYAGNSVNMYLSGMPVGKIVPYQAKAAKLLNGADDLMKKVAQGGVDALTDVEKSNWKLLQQFYEGGFANAGTAVRDLEKVQESIKLGSKANPLNKASDISMKLNQNADAMNRMALLMYANGNEKYLKKLGAKNPIQAVKYALMDPSNMSEFEQNVVKKIIPFYTFTKQNLMFQATNLSKNTPKYKALVKALNNAYSDLPEDSYYSYQKESMQIPIPGATDDDGNQLFLKANLPLSDLGEFLSNPIQRTAASLTPLIKAPIEYTTGKSLFTGDDTTYNNLSKTLTNMGVTNQGITNSADAAELILNNFGLQNVSSNLVKKVQAIIDASNGEKSGQQMWAEIFRSVLQNTKQESVKESGLYDEMEKYQAEIRRLKSQGIDVPTIKEITASNNIKINNLKRKRARSN